MLKNIKAQMRADCSCQVQDDFVACGLCTGVCSRYARFQLIASFGCNVIISFKNGFADENV